MWIAWISWMPLLQVLDISDEQNLYTFETTTISHTFAKFNTEATLFFVGPYSVIFLFRFVRITDSKYITHSTKRILIILIIFIQYTTMVVVRNDTIIDNWHYTFTGITFGLVYTYHYTMHDNCIDDTHADNLYYIKNILACFGIICLCVFAFLVFWDSDDIYKSDGVTAYWAVTCILEILGVFFTATLDLVDVYRYGYTFDCNCTY